MSRKYGTDYQYAERINTALAGYVGDQRNLDAPGASDSLRSEVLRGFYVERLGNKSGRVVLADSLIKFATENNNKSKGSKTQKGLIEEALAMNEGDTEEEKKYSAADKIIQHLPIGLLYEWFEGHLNDSVSKSPVEKEQVKTAIRHLKKHGMIMTDFQIENLFNSKSPEQPPIIPRLLVGNLDIRYPNGVPEYVLMNGVPYSISTNAIPSKISF